MAHKDDQAKDVKEAADEVAEEARDAARRARDKADEYSDSVRKLGREYAELTRDEARRLYRRGRREMHEIADHAEDYYYDLSSVVRRNPVQSLGVAAGVGLLVGLMIARR
ncbi:MAG: YqjD family protein [Paracoccus sp. (in: a-proteobacteria)]